MCAHPILSLSIMLLFYLCSEPQSPIIYSCPLLELDYAISVCTNKENKAGIPGRDAVPEKQTEIKDNALKAAVYACVNKF